MISGRRSSFPSQQELLALIPGLKHQPPVDTAHRNRLEDNAFRKIQRHVRRRNAEQCDFPARSNQFKRVTNARAASGHLQHDIDAARFARMAQKPFLPAVFSRIESRRSAET